MEKDPIGTPPVTRLRVTEKRDTGIHVRFETADGRQRQAWVPSAILDDAKAKLQEHLDLVAATDGEGALGTSAADVLAILCAQTGPGFDEALYEASWVGPSPDELASLDPETEPYAYGQVQVYRGGSPDLDSIDTEPHSYRDEPTTVPAPLPAPRHVPRSPPPSPHAMVPPSHEQGVDGMTLGLMALAGASTSLVLVLALIAWFVV